MKNSIRLDSLKRQAFAKAASRYDTKGQLIGNSRMVFKNLMNNIVARGNSSLNTDYINYQQIVYNSANKQYLKRFYSMQQYKNKNELLAQYYKFHIDFPYHIDAKIHLIMLNYQQSKNKYQRILIKKIINQSISDSSMQQSQKNAHRNDQSFKQHSCKLKGLDSQQSSIMLQQICQQINTAFENVKPLYFYKGTYKDYVKEFQKFLSLEKQKKSKKGIFKQQQKQKILYQQVGGDSNTNEINTNRGNKIKTKETLVIPLTRKIGFSKQLRKTIHNSLIPSETIHKMKRNNTFTKLKRNKTMLLKPQSFSKTHETISKDQNTEKNIRRKSQNQIRIRKCKSTTKKMLSRTKSINNFTKASELEAKNKQNEQKNYKKQVYTSNKRYLPAISKQIDKKEEKMISIHKNIQRNGSKNTIRRLNNVQKQQKNPSKMTVTIDSLIKNKLKLRA